MTTATKPQPAASSTPAVVGTPPPWSMPKPLGPIVIFKASRGFSEEKALVAGIEPHSLQLLVFAQGSSRLHPRGSVRHRDDPEIATLAEYSDGTWEDTPESISLATRLRELEMKTDTLL